MTYARLKDHDVPLVENAELIETAMGLVAQVVGRRSSWLGRDHQRQIPKALLQNGRVRAIMHPEGSDEPDFILDDPDAPTS